MAGVIRPWFELEAPVLPERVTEQVHRRLTASDCPVGGLTAPGRIELHVPSQRQQLWSPQLVIDLRRENDVTSVRGEFGPHPYVWILYVAAIALSAIGCLVAASFGTAQWTMGHTPTAFWAIPLLLVLLLLLYLAAVAGRELSKSEMAELRSFFDGALSDAVALSLREHESVPPSSDAASALIHDTSGPALASH
ncbi:MAG TPA: hypothetical protein VFQ35_08930 [Polyangiaceae bacterium]|nr:hypothetical protein [Polyangiaceae bacterium]